MKRASSQVGRVCLLFSLLAAANTSLFAAESASTPPATLPDTPTEADKKKEQELLEFFQKHENITNSLGMVMVWIPAGFRVAEFETSQALFESLLNRNPSKFQGANRPVEHVTVGDAKEFCQKLTQKEQTEGKLPKSFSYALPTESEFEAYGEGTPLAVAWVSLIGDRPSTTDVGSTPADKLGLREVRGNVWEWCDNGVARGSSYQSHEDYLSPTFRFVGQPDTAIDDVGFRVILKETGGN